MPATHDYHCLKCGAFTEVTWLRFEDFRRDVECGCGGVAVQTWRKAPGLAGVSEPGTRGITRTFEPGRYDIQAGRSFASRSERDRYLKAKGLIAMGPEEFKRTRDNANEPEITLPNIKDAMKEAWEEASSSKEVEPLPSIPIEDVNIVGGI